MEEEPGFDIFFKGLGHCQFGRPFNIVAFIVGVDTRFSHRQVFPVESLYRFEFEETGTCRIGRGYILGQLCMGAGRRTEWCFQFAVKYRIGTGRISLI